MAGRAAATHDVQVDAGRAVVIKRFRSWDRGEPAREWAALALLAEYAPGLAATPLRADLAADPPVIEMSWLPGVPLGGTALSAEQADALALAVQRLWTAVPRARLADLGDPGLNAAQLVRRAAGSPGYYRNPPGTLERQAARLLFLLDCDQPVEATSGPPQSVNPKACCP